MSDGQAEAPATIAVDAGVAHACHMFAIEFEFEFERGGAPTFVQHSSQLCHSENGSMLASVAGLGVAA
ncbi:hypothetical protein HYPGJ_10213 [Hyphomicrobium sp. GJ21]|nr:hypothetical protein HYPGJ_10213 [Hyphomicrobium sp. GJ21]